jgi:superfamily I DNA/RNA helicase
MSLVPLNEEQLAAVQHPLDAPACLIAGAGSGKTRVLTERVRWLMGEAQASPERILCLTFTNKAAEEMMSRLNIVKDDSRTDIPHVSTIHSLAISYIRREPGSFGYRGRISSIDEYGQGQMLLHLIEAKTKEANSEKFESMNSWLLAEKIGFHRARGLGFQAEYTPEYDKRARERHGGYHAMNEEELDIWFLYELEKRKNRVVDFDDMLHLCVRRGRADAAWHKLLGDRFDHILMDEAQDTNPVQWEFVNMLVGEKNKNFYVVGDMSQSIYGFNGALPKLLKEYSEDWRGTVPSLYRIQRNHLSVPEIVALANAIQRKMTETIPIQMESWRGINGEHGKAKLVQADLPSDLAEIIAREIYMGANRETPPIPYKENVILVRSASQIRDIEGELVKLRIPYIVRGGKGLLGTEEVRDVLAYMRLAANPNDFGAFSRAVSAPRRGVGKVAMGKLKEVAEAACGGDLIKACSMMPGKLDGFRAVMKEIQESMDDAATALASVFSAVGYVGYLKEKYGRDPDKVRLKMENLGRLGVLIKGLTETGCVTTEDVVFRLSLEKAPEGDTQGQVVISTIHASKGLEWYRVYVFSVVEGYLPHKWCRLPEEIEEERRLWYVAVTRAKDRLVVCLPNRIQYPNSEPKKVQPSRFLFEVGILK